MKRTSAVRSRHTTRSRREFLSTLGKGAGIACAGGFALPGLGAEAASPPSKRALLEVLKAAGKPARVLTQPDGTAVVLLPYGGRVLGLYAPGREENFYWTHSALRSAETARTFYASSEWHNSGGDRTWLAPEVDLFFPNFPKLDGYFQQRSLDPGNYRVVETKDGFKLVNRLTVSLSRAQERARSTVSSARRSTPS